VVKKIRDLAGVKVTAKVEQVTEPYFHPSGNRVVAYHRPFKAFARFALPSFRLQESLPV
jgi:hypothetical protein